MWELLLLLVIGYLWYVNRTANKKCASGDGIGTVVFRFHKPSCPYCVESKGAWDRFKHWAYSNGINAIEEDITNNRINADKYDVKSVPTVIMVKDGKVVSKHSGPRSAEHYIAWASANC